MITYCRNALNERPFINGYFHRTAEQTETYCKITFAASPSSETTYYLGRVVRFIVSIPGSIVDVALQILECIAVTLETIIMRVESRIRNIPPEETCSLVIHEKGLWNLISIIRFNTTGKETYYLRQDLGYIRPGIIFNEDMRKNDNMGTTFAVVYRAYLNKKLPPR